MCIYIHIYIYIYACASFCFSHMNHQDLNRHSCPPCPPRRPHDFLHKQSHITIPLGNLLILKHLEPKIDIDWSPPKSSKVPSFFLRWIRWIVAIDSLPHIRHLPIVAIPYRSRFVKGSDDHVYASPNACCRHTIEVLF